MGLSVCGAKIATVLDQVVNVFYVTDNQGRKIDDLERLDEIRRQLIEVIDTRGESNGMGAKDEG